MLSSFSLLRIISSGLFQLFQLSLEYSTLYLPFHTVPEVCIKLLYLQDCSIVIVYVCFASCFTRTISCALLLAFDKQ